MRATTQHYAAVIAKAILAARIDISARWLARLNEILEVAPNQVFPSEQLLDHIPMLIGEIATYLQAPEAEEIAANTTVIEKARELGTLRHEQGASVHQLLREYEILGELLEEFVQDETLRQSLDPAADDCFEVVSRLNRATRILMRTTVDTFVEAFTETLNERNERIDRFNRMASHELRTPIGTLTFASQLLAVASVREDAHKLEQVSTIIGNNVERLAWLIDNLQRVARLTDDGEDLTQQRIEVTTLANEAARQLAEMADARGVEIIVQPAMPAIHTDPARLELIFLNLLSNGVKYSDPAKPERTVEVLCEPQPRADGRWHLCVRDNGLGIPTGQQAQVFKRFVRAHAHLDATLGVRGSGLGLSIVAECVEALGGSITCHSEPGQGTSFWISLPASSGPAEA